MIPQPPKSEKIKFPDIDKRGQKINLYKEIKQTLLELRNILPRARDKEIIIRFIGCINPGSLGGDVSRLPYESDKPFAKQPKKSACLFALVSWMIQQHWMCVAFNEDRKHIIEQYLKQIKGIIVNGLPAYDVVGNEREGFCLELRKQ